MAPSRASAALRAWTNTHSQQALADRLSKRLNVVVPQGTISAWSRGRLPRTRMVLALHIELGIDPGDWLRPASARDIANAEKAFARRKARLSG